MGTGNKVGWSLEKWVGGNHENRGRAPREMGEESRSNGWEKGGWSLEKWVLETELVY